MTNEKYLISTNVHGIICGNYDTEKTLCLAEAVIILQRVRQGDPNARLVKVVEIIGGAANE